MVARAVQVNAEEGRSQIALDAIEKERLGHQARGTWDLTTVRECTEWMNDKSIVEAIFGRAS